MSKFTNSVVHFGSGNIGRGLIGKVMYDSGYEIIFVDTDLNLVNQLKRNPTYPVLTIDHGVETSITVGNYRALHLYSETDAVIKAVAEATILTTSVGSHNLPSIAHLIAVGLEKRVRHLGPLTVIACENQQGASTALERLVRQSAGDYRQDSLLRRAVFADTVIDRIVPSGKPQDGLTIRAESHFEWTIDRTPFSLDEHPRIRGTTWVSDLAATAERKLFTVNTAHATAAYHGYVLGFDLLGDCFSDPFILNETKKCLMETGRLIIDKYGIPKKEQYDHAEQVIGRISNPFLRDSVARVGRHPMRKLGRSERLVSPAAQLVERGFEADALLRAIGASLRFYIPEDKESVKLRKLLKTSPNPNAIVTEVMGLEEEHPAYSAVATVVHEAIT